MSHLNIKYVQETPAGHTSRERDRENSPRMITYTNFATLANILWTYLQQIYEA